MGTKPSMPGYFGSKVRLAVSAMEWQTVAEQLTLAMMPLPLLEAMMPSAKAADLAARPKRQQIF